MDGEFWAEIFLEASLISFFITILYFLVFIKLEEHVILEQTKDGINTIIDEFIIPISLLPEEKKQEYINSLENYESSPIDPELSKSINDNNSKVFTNAIYSVIVYSGITLLLSVIAWRWFKDCKTSKRYGSYFKNVLAPSLFAVFLVVMVEYIFIVIFMGYFIPIDTNKTMTKLLDSFKNI